MKNRILWVILIGSLWSFAGCQPKATPEEYNAKAAQSERYHQCVKQLTDVIIHDIFSPPVASRIYGYANLAGYEAMVPGQPGYESLGGKLRKFTAPPKPEAGKEYCFPLASTRAFPDRRSQSDVFRVICSTVLKRNFTKITKPLVFPTT
jgi:hypothetical protein